MALYLISIVIILAVIYIARKPRPVPDRDGSAFNLINDGSTYLRDQNTTNLRVASFNVQTGKSLAGKRDISRAAALLKNVDIAGIQEVYAKSWANKLGIGICQTEALANPGKFAWLFCPTRYRWFRENRGNAILSRLPILAWQTTLLTDQSGISFRNMTVANFEWQGQSCRFINTHLHTSRGKIEQLKEVLEEFDKYSRVILVGDFNCTPENELLKNHFASNDVIDAISYCHIDDNEDQRIDWIITKGWKAKSGKIVEKGISDHPYYEIELELQS